MGLNACKYLLFQDVLCGLFDKHVQPGYNAYYAETAERLATAGAAGRSLRLSVRHAGRFMPGAVPEE